MNDPSELTVKFFFNKFIRYENSGEDDHKDYHKQVFLAVK